MDHVTPDPLAEALSLLTAWLDGDDSCATLQRARAWVDARRAGALHQPTEYGPDWVQSFALRIREPLEAALGGGETVRALTLPALADLAKRVIDASRSRCPHGHPWADCRDCWSELSVEAPTASQPTDPPPSADYQGPGWPDGVGRG